MNLQPWLVGCALCEKNFRKGIVHCEGFVILLGLNLHCLATINSLLDLGNSYHKFFFWLFMYQLSFSVRHRQFYLHKHSVVTYMFKKELILQGGTCVPNPLPCSLYIHTEYLKCALSWTLSTTVQVNEEGHIAPLYAYFGSLPSPSYIQIPPFKT